VGTTVDFNEKSRTATRSVGSGNEQFISGLQVASAAAAAAADAPVYSQFGD